MQIQKVIGLDVGGTKVRGVMYDLSEQDIETTIEEPTTTETLASFLRQLERFVTALQEESGHNADAIGVGVPSFLDRDRKRVLGSTNFDLLADIVLSSTLSDRLSVPVRLENDANCAALAEALLGAGRGKRYVVALTLGTGMGSGIVFDETIFVGAHGGAGEAGYMVVPEIVESDGKDDHPPVLEWHASEKLLAELFGTDDPIAVEQDAREGDEAGQYQYAVLGQYVGMGIASIANFIDPDIVVIAGGLSHAWDLMRESAQTAMDDLIASPAVRDNIIVAPADLEPDSGAIGAALLWRSEDTINA